MAVDGTTCGAGVGEKSNKSCSPVPDCKTLSVTNCYPADALTHADALVDSLEGLTLKKLNSSL